MAGRLIYLMGPSGSGKDTVLQGLSSLLGGKAYLAPRVVTRGATGTEPGAVAVTLAEFEHMETCGRLAMAWRAHGLAYGVMRDINDRLVAGCDVLVNGSRAYLPEAQSRYADLVPVLLSVEPRLLRQRLQSRGRESAEQIQARLRRNARFMRPVAAGDARPVLLLDNSADPDSTIQALYAHLTQAPPPQSAAGRPAAHRLAECG
ncbi:ribose 1,5-bisphosphokinase [Pollutimonas bauzanensis]|uniref:Ribose 1,5-bisphosphate phosphokinase PhnN n=2 Tax=Pollutimonas bauzanensis TaxID=658167 RepID=A0A1M5MCL6_9BURK|nr:ribose 1,5-bisphosphokinase [Pollutimonas bauzanensis]